MADLTTFHAKICLTASGVLIVDERVLLVKHKKLGIWLNPGGHMEENEAPHQAAEREFWEETSLKVQARRLDPLHDETDDSTYLPSPILTNLHWISRENYDHRLHGAETSQQTRHNWGKGCEQHLNFVYLVEPVADEHLNFHQNVEETDGIAWFSESDLPTLETRDNIKLEVQYAFQKLRKEI